MNPEKLVKYSVPVFTLAIVSRSIEEISFIYYAVPVLCVFFIVFNLQRVRSQKLKVKSQNPESEIRNLASSIKKFPSPIRLRQGLAGQVFHQPFTIFLIPGIWFLVTSLWSSYPEISAARALYFILISTGCLSAGFLWMQYSDSHKSIFSFLLPANIVVILLSLFSLITNIPSDSWSGGHGKGFMGFFGHQNLLASVLLFTLPSVLYRVIILVRLQSRPRQGRAKSRIINVITPDSRRTSFAGMTEAGLPSFRPSSESDRLTDTSYASIQYPESNIPIIIAYYLLLTANLLLLALTYSRSAILSLIFGVVVFLILNKSWKILSYSFISAAVFAIIIYFTPSLNQFADKILKKDFPEFYTSRIWMWEPSFRAALEGGVIGLGYGISNPKEKIGGTGDHFEDDRFVREKGNSTLALIEESGLIGLILFLIPLTLLLKHGWMDALMRANHEHAIMQSCNHSILIASLVAFLLHAQFEAWWVGVGSIQLPLFFIFLGLMSKDWLIVRLNIF